METQFDIAIVGGGPIGASTAYHLAKSGKKIAVIARDPADDVNHESTFAYAGGSVRWFFDDQDLAQATQETARFIQECIEKKIDLSEIQDSYVFMHRGLAAPSFNISGAKLVDHLLGQAENNGMTRFKKTTLDNVQKKGDTYELQTSGGILTAKKVLLALGASLRKFIPENEFEFEKRQLLVLDLEVSKERQSFPHVIVPVQGGIAYVFIKNVGGTLKVVVGQEGIIQENDKAAPDDYLAKLLEAGLGEMMPFLKDAKTEKVLWGFDAFNKKLKIYSPDGQLFAAACGSAIRSAMGIGRELSQKLLD